VARFRRGLHLRSARHGERRPSPSRVTFTIRSYTIERDQVKRLRLHRTRSYTNVMEKENFVKTRRREPSNSTPLELGEFLCFAVYSASHAFNRVYQPLLKESGLTYPQFIAMVLLWEQDDQTVGDLGQKLFLQSNTITPMLKRLESLGYVKRSRDSTDERQVRVKLTEQGRKLQMQASEIVRRVRNATGLQEKQVRQLTQEVNTLRKELQSHNSR
jgi:MarR family transcriptional regulator, organic hydroperoxide resistance regulator